VFHQIEYVWTNDNVMVPALQQVQSEESLATAARRGLFLKGIIPVFQAGGLIAREQKETPVRFRQSFLTVKHP
jgi:hypothetical protein